MEAVIAKPLLGGAGVVGRLDRATERTRVPKSCIVDENQKNVGRAIGWCRVAHQIPVGLRAVQRPIYLSGEEGPADREMAAIDVAHRCLPPGSSRFLPPSC